MKKSYIAPKAELIRFAIEDVITSSNIFDWETPSIGVGKDDDGNWDWGETFSFWKTKL